MRKRQGEKWEQEDINKLLEFISEERPLYMADIERLKKEIPDRGDYAIYQKIKRLSKDLGVRFCSRGVEAYTRPGQIRKREEQKKLKPITKEEHMSDGAIIDAIIGGMVKAVKELINTKAGYQKEFEDRLKIAEDSNRKLLSEQVARCGKLLKELKDAYKITEILTKDNQGLKDQLRSLTGIKEAAEKYRDRFLNGGGL